MNQAASKLCSALLSVVVMAGLAWAPSADAIGGGGHAGGGGGARAGGGGGARAGGGGGGAQVNNRSADVRTNNVRNTSVNNVNNVNRNTNVVVTGGGNNGCRNCGWDNDYHPIATAAAVTATVAATSAIVGSMVRSVPAGCVPVNYGGMVYQQCGTTWYQPQAGQYVVINPPY
jgi:hypothetical protein